MTPQKTYTWRNKHLVHSRLVLKLIVQPRSLDKKHLKLTWLVFFLQMSKVTKTISEIRTAVDTNYPGVAVLSAQQGASQIIRHFNKKTLQ